MSSKDDKPKRPKNGYFLYRDDVYGKVKAANPEKPITELSKIIAAEYAALPQAKKADYEATYKKAMDKYNKDMEKFHAKGGDKKEKAHAEAAKDGKKGKEEKKENKKDEKTHKSVDKAHKSVDKVSKKSEDKKPKKKKD